MWYGRLYPFSLIPSSPISYICRSSRGNQQEVARKVGSWSHCTCQAEKAKTTPPSSAPASPQPRRRSKQIGEPAAQGQVKQGADAESAGSGQK